MGKLTVEDILSSVDVEEQEVEVPQWKGTVTIRPFTKEAQQRARKQAMSDGEIDTDRLEMILFIEGVIEPKFTEDHYEALRQKNAAAIDLVLKEIMSASGITEDEAKKAGAFFRD
jgi:hypothetical protein